MKTSGIILTLAAWLLAGNAHAQLPNADFEDWTTDTVLTYPEEWTVSEQFYGIPGQPFTGRSRDSHSGAFSLELWSVEIEGDTIGGIALLGGLDEFGEPEGIAYSDQVDSIRGWVNLDLLPGDTAFMLIQFSWNGEASSFNVIPFSGVSGGWVPFSHGIENPLAPHDTLFLYLAMGGEESELAQPGSVLRIDSLHFTTNVIINPTPAPIPNGDFEAWNLTTALVPDGAWGHFNRELAVLGYPASIDSTHDGFENTAVVMETIVIDEDTLPGFLFLGEVVNEGFAGGIPYTGPQNGKLSGYVKYQPNGSDNGGVLLQFYNAMGNVTGGDSIPLPNTGSEYIPFSIDFTNSAMPAEIGLVFFAGEIPGSVLYVDKLEITETVGISETDMAAAGRLWPNPAQDRVHWTVSGHDADAQWVLINGQGQQIPVRPARSGNTCALTLDGIPAGVYMIQNATTGAITGRFVRE